MFNNQLIIGTASGVLVLLIDIFWRRWIIKFFLFPYKVVKYIIDTSHKVNETMNRLEVLESEVSKVKTALDNHVKLKLNYPPDGSLYLFRSLIWCFDKNFEVGPYCQSCAKTNKGLYDVKCFPDPSSQELIFGSFLN